MASNAYEKDMALVQGGVRQILIVGDEDGAGYRTVPAYNILPGGF